MADGHLGGETGRAWHALSTDAVLAALGTTRDGLSANEVGARLSRVGHNVLPEAKPPGRLQVYLRQFRSPLIYLLFIAAGISLVLGEFTDAAFIFAAVQVNAIVGTWQEWKAQTGAESLRSMIRSDVVVRRGGHRTEVDSRDIVPGDILLLEAGDRVPADLRLIRGLELKVDESLLTGESVPVSKDAGATVAEAAPVGDRLNTLHAGTVLLYGRAETVVARTAAHTEIGTIAQAMERSEPAPPPLVLRLRSFSRMLGILIIIAVAIFAVTRWLRGDDLGEIFIIAVALAVAAIPEGLPVAITVALSVGAARMARRNVIVRSLPAVEGLGACTLIASDKTGTLTCNELTIRKLLLPDVGELDVSGSGYAPGGSVTRAGQPLGGGSAREAALDLARAGALCNDASYRVRPDGDHELLGDTVDVAFLVLAHKLGLDRDRLLEEAPEYGAVPFDATRRFAASVNRVGGTLVAHVKGAAEAVVPMCFDAGCTDAGQAALDAADRMAGDGFRVLALACGEVDAGEIDAGAGDNGFHRLRFLGLVGVIDPLRAEVPAAIEAAQRAGLQVRMVTGDHPATALAISRELGIAAEPADITTGKQLAQLENDPLGSDELIAHAKGFARVEPLQKLAIVHAQQRAGHFVAVTGDGVNDAPALRAAHIGVAMGKKGTDVARDAADLILTDDNFASIIAGIEEGRIAYDNVRKVVYLLVSTGAAEITLFLLSMILGLPIPLFAVQLLWLNLVTQGIQDVSLAFERGEPGILNRQPRPPDQPIFDKRMIEQTAISGVFIGIVVCGVFWWLLRSGSDEFQARNMLLLLLVLFVNVHVFNCRSERISIFRLPLAANPFVVLAAVGAQATHIVAMYVPGLREVLRIEPVSPAIWAQVAAVALSLVVVMEIYKLWRRRRG